MIEKLTEAGTRLLHRASRTHPVGAARRLLRAGRTREAITRLTEAFVASDDAELAQELVRLRYDAAVRNPSTRDPGTWPPVVPDLFAGTVRIPEITPAAFGPETLGAGIVHHGGLIVRGLLASDEVSLLTACVRRAFAAQRRYREGSMTREDRKWFHEFRVRDSKGVLYGGRGFADDGSGILGADSPATVHEVLRVAEARGIVAAVEAFLGERPAVSVMKTTLRVVPPTTGTGWHQDGAFLGDYVRSVNMWIALSECGEDAPSLDIIPKRFDHIVPTGTDGTPFPWSVAECVAERAAREAGVEIVHEHFAPGDVIFFDHMNLHRTGVRPGMTKERLAIEWWFFAPSRFPVAQIPILA